MDALYQFGIHLIQSIQTLSPATSFNPSKPSAPRWMAS